MGKTVLKARVYDVVGRAVEEGLKLGWQHAHKHVDAPSKELILDRLEDDIMNQLCEVIDFDAR